MCGRYALTATPEEVADVLGLDSIEAFPPRYNIAPTQPILVAAIGPNGKRQSLLVRWGLVPSWVRDPENFTLLINARSETAAGKPSFRNAMRHRRILVPASGFYEWHRPADRKSPSQAYWIRPKNCGLVTLAGLMECWLSADGSEIYSGCILTTAANHAISAIHDRMPAVIAPENHQRWLDCSENEPRDVADLLLPAGEHLFEAIPISAKINKVANAGRDVQLPLSAPRQNAPAQLAVKPRARTTGGAGENGKDDDADQYDLF
jgi:putative SOS response-associated peptidase YedK